MTAYNKKIKTAHLCHSKISSLIEYTHTLGHIFACNL